MRATIGWILLRCFHSQDEHLHDRQHCAEAESASSLALWLECVVFMRRREPISIDIVCGVRATTTTAVGETGQRTTAEG